MMKRLVISALFLFLAASAFPVTAQDTDEYKAIRRQALAKFMPRSFGLTVQITADGKTLNSMFIEHGDYPDMQQFLGTTDEQYQAFSDFMFGTRTAYQAEMRPLFEQLAAENDPEKIAELVDTFQTHILAMIDNAEVKAAEILTPEQILKIRELELHRNQIMEQEGFPIYSFEGYEALNLTPEQQKQLHEIRDGFRKEQAELIEQFSKTQPKPGEKLSKQEMEKRMKQIRGILDQGKKLMVRMKMKVRTILTKEQSSKLEDLLKKTPEAFTNMMKRQGAPPPKIDEKKYDEWKKSWKPGDPIPEEYRQHEKARRRSFP